MIHKSILCIDFPPLIKLELRDSYWNWYDSCFFGSIDLIQISCADLIILPAVKLIESKKNIIPRIAFGPVEMLETSYLCGAVDFLKDPWFCSELIIRCQPFLEGLTLQNGNISLVYRKGTLLINEKNIHLSPLQNRLLMILMKNCNSFVPYTLLVDLLGIKSDNPIQSLHVHIHKLRRSLKQELPLIYGNSINIKNSSTLGYALISTCG